MNQFPSPLRLLCSGSWQIFLVKQIFAAGSVRLARHDLAFGVLVGSALMLSAVFKVVLNACGHYFFPFLGFFAVNAAALNAPLAGAPLAPTLRIFSPDPALILAFFAAMFPYNDIKFHPFPQ
jgi:hypothetical protein